MKLTIIIIGDEILLGQVADTNSGYIARTLGPMGWTVVKTVVIGDQAADIRQAVEESMEHSDLVITTGGLGPTKDDITKKTLAQLFGNGMRWDDDVLANIERVFSRRGLTLNELTRYQALVPDGCSIIQNQFGTAPIMWWERGEKVLVSMPGVPFEMEGMMAYGVAERIRQHFHRDASYEHHTMLVSGLPESALAQRLAPYEESLLPCMHLAYLPQAGYIRLRLDGVLEADNQGQADEFQKRIEQLRQQLGELLVFDGDVTLADALLRSLRERGLTLSTAESCTGGTIAQRITAIAGCSDVYMGGVVSYSNHSKERLIGVSEADLAAHGAVSEPVARQMAQGVARELAASCSMSTTGIAGPGGAVEGKPVGTVWIAAHTPWGNVARECHFPGNRQRVIDRAATEAMLLLLAQLREHPRQKYDRP